MKKIFTVIAILAIAATIVACGGKENTLDESSKITDESSIIQDSKPESIVEVSESAPPAAESSGWNNPEYSEYTTNVPEPQFEYTIFGVIGNMGMSFNSSATIEEIDAWRDTLIESGFELNVQTGETWVVYNDSCSISHSGGGYFNISAK